ncbi:MAG: BMP family ABC transporter substrate-binding protein, partial [Treponema sp.]|nr:BMP family ABC transporter substrate-binding protein [Treponema sp.]
MRKTAAGVMAVFVLAVLAVPAFFTGCGESAPRWTPGKPFPRDRIKIGIIHPNEINETSLYDWAHYEGTVEMQRTLGLRDDQIIRRVNVFEEDQAETEAVIRECISEGAVIIIAPSWNYMETCEKLA